MSTINEIKAIDGGDLRSNCCFVDKVRWRPGAVITRAPFSVADLFLEERGGILELCLCDKWIDTGATILMPHKCRSTG